MHSTNDRRALTEQLARRFPNNPDLVPRALALLDELAVCPNGSTDDAFLQALPTPGNEPLDAQAFAYVRKLLTLTEHGLEVRGDVQEILRSLRGSIDKLWQRVNGPGLYEHELEIPHRGWKAVLVIKPHTPADWDDLSYRCSVKLHPLPAASSAAGAATPCPVPLPQPNGAAPCPAPSPQPNGAASSPDVPRRRRRRAPAPKPADVESEYENPLLALQVLDTIKAKKRVSIGEALGWFHEEDEAAVRVAVQQLYRAGKLVLERGCYSVPPAE